MTNLAIDFETALRTYVAANGDDWKDDLLRDWAGACSSSTLIALRDTHGPAWLKAFKLPAPKLPTLAELAGLDAKVLDIRFGGNEKRRPPRFEQLVRIIQHYFPDLGVSLSDWSVTPYRKIKRIRHVTGQQRDGKRLILTKDGKSRYAGGEIVLDHKTCETYRTNWDVLRWIVQEARRRKMV